MLAARGLLHWFQKGRMAVATKTEIQVELVYGGIYKMCHVFPADHEWEWGSDEHDGSLLVINDGDSVAAEFPERFVLSVRRKPTVVQP